MSTRGERGGMAGAVPVRAGAVAGGIAFAAGYVLTLVTVLLDGLLAGDGGGGETAEMATQFLEFVGTVFFDAHYVDVQLASDALTGTTDVVSELDLLFPVGVYYAIPAGLLLGAGFLVAGRHTDGPESPRTAALTGASIVVAYLPLVAVGSTLFVVDGSISGYEFTLAPNVRLSVLRAGIAYPVVLGAVGGLVADGLGRR